MYKFLGISRFYFIFNKYLNLGVLFCRASDIIWMFSKKFCILLGEDALYFNYLELYQKLYNYNIIYI